MTSPSARAAGAALRVTAEHKLRLATAGDLTDLHPKVAARFLEIAEIIKVH